MKPIRRLKQSILNRLFRRPAVLNDAFAKAIENPEVLRRALQNKALRNKIIDEISRDKSAAQQMVQHPDIADQIARVPTFFDAMLERTAGQPEALLRILNARGMRTKLAAQKGFLQYIARDKKLVTRIIQNVPQANLPDATNALFAPYRSQIVAQDSTQDDLALALLAAIDPTSQASGDLLTDILEVHLQEKLPELVGILVQRDPDLMVGMLENPKLRKTLVTALSANMSTLLSVLRDYAIMSKDAPTVALRFDRMFSKILSEKVVVKALTDEPDLRNALLARLDDIYNSIGDSVEGNLPQARATLAGKAAQKEDAPK